jgi:hypothetical protein
MKNPFITGTTKIGPLTLRDLTARDYLILAELEASKALDLSTVIATVWVAWGNRVETMQMIRDGVANQAVEEFIDAFPARLIAPAQAWFEGQQKDRSDAQVEIVESIGGPETGN